MEAGEEGEEEEDEARDEEDEVIDDGEVGGDLLSDSEED